MPRTRRLPPLSANRDNSRLDKIHTKKYNEVKANLLKYVKKINELEIQNNEQESEIKRLTNLLKNSNSIIRSIRYILLQNN